MADAEQNFALTQFTINTLNSGGGSGGGMMGHSNGTHDMVNPPGILGKQIGASFEQAQQQFTFPLLYALNKMIQGPSGYAPAISLQAFSFRNVSPGAAVSLSTGNIPSVVSQKGKGK